MLAVSIDQALKGIVIFVLNVVFGVPLAVVLGFVAFLIGFFPLLGEWAVYVPVSVYLIVFRDQMTGGLIYLAVGIALSLASSLLIRPRLAAHGARRFNFYWMLIALVTGVLTFGIPGIVLGPAILGFAKSIVDTLFGDVRYETSLLKSENETKVNEAGNDDEAGDEEAPAEALAETR